jgi:hypothetical protein
MKNIILTLGKALNRAEQQKIRGGGQYTCAPQYSQANCDEYCGNTETSLYYNMDIGNNDAAMHAMCALVEHCGGVLLGDDDNTCKLPTIH